MGKDFEIKGTAGTIKKPKEMNSKRKTFFKKAAEVAKTIPIPYRSAKRLLAAKDTEAGQVIVNIIEEEITKKWAGRENDLPASAIENLLEDLARAKYGSIKQITIWNNNGAAHIYATNAFEPERLIIE